jgi:hypothetical protein
MDFIFYPFLVKLKNNWFKFTLHLESLLKQNNYLMDWISQLMSATTYELKQYHDL